MAHYDLPAPFQHVLTLDVNHKEVPREVYIEVSEELWVEEEQSNGSTMWYVYQSKLKDGISRYPVLDAYLDRHDIRECEITYSW